MPVRPEVAPAEEMKRRFGMPPDVAVVLGSGLGPAVDFLEDVEGEVDYADLGLPTVGVVGHHGRMVVGRLGQARAAFFCGRSHVYEQLGNNLEPVVRGVRAAALWGVPNLVLTASTGGLHAHLQPGTLVRLVDFLDFTGTSPLIGPEVPERGPRFLDVSEAYCPQLGARLDAAAASVGGPWTTGVYAFSRGPAFETPTLVRALATLGGDVVGMSTVPETLAARQMGMTVAGISVVSNPGAGLVDGPLDHAEVLQEAGPVAARLGEILRAAWSTRAPSDH
jgi:purine-nucleoside phosphorylase